MKPFTFAIAQAFLYGIIALFTSGCLLTTNEREKNATHKRLVLPRRGEKSTTSKGKMNREISFVYNGDTYTLPIRVDEKLYDYYKGQPKTLSYEFYATEFIGHTYIKNIADKLKSIAQKQGLDDEGLVELTMAFIQEGFPYAHDPYNAGHDYPRFPIELFIEGHGDCEDKAAALACLLTYFNFDVVLVYLPNHMAVAINCKNCDGGYYEYAGKRYAFIESTAEGWQIASVPPQYQSANATLLHVPTSPYKFTDEKIAKN